MVFALLGSVSVKSDLLFLILPFSFVNGLTVSGSQERLGTFEQC